VGNGWGLLDLTSTAGGSLPITSAKQLGHTITWNNAAQSKLAHTGAARFFYPEVELNSSFVQGGANDGKTTSLGHAGLLIGHIPLTHDASGKPGRLGLADVWRGRADCADEVPQQKS
jgi:hypothetical protein